MLRRAAAATRTGVDPFWTGRVLKVRCPAGGMSANRVRLQAPRPRRPPCGADRHSARRSEKPGPRTGAALVAADRQRGPARLADPAHPAARAAASRTRLTRAAENPAAGSDAGRRGRRASGAGRGRDHLSGCPSRRDHRRPDRPVDRARPHRSRATGDPRSVPRRRLRPHCRHVRRGQGRHAALHRHRGSHRQCQAGRRYQPGRHAGAAVPEPLAGKTANRPGDAGALAAASAGPPRGVGPCRAAPVDRRAGRARTGGAGQPAAGQRAVHA